LNDSGFQAAFLARTLLGVLPLRVHAMGYYMMSDIQLRYADTLDMLFGGWGLFSDKNLPKPSYHTYSLFSKLGRFLLQAGKNYLVTCHSPSSFQCLFFHYEHITPDFVRKNAKCHDFFVPGRLFCTTAADHWDLTIPDVPQGVYLIKEYTISDTQSNLLTEWFKIQFITPSKEEDDTALKTLSALVPQIYAHQVSSSGQLSVQVSLRGQEVKLLQIELNAMSVFAPQGG
jgi:beta-xylosidase